MRWQSSHYKTYATVRKKCIHIHMIFPLLFVLPLILHTSEIKAQSSSGSVTINIILHPVQTISVNTSQQTTDILYASIENYHYGVSVTQDDHLTIFSTGGFMVSVEVSNKNFTRVGGSEVIPSSDVIIRPVAGTNNITNSDYFEVPLSTTSTPIISSTTGGRDLKYSIIYDNSVAGAGNRYINRYVKADGTESVYRSQVTYTITTK